MSDLAPLPVAIPIVMAALLIAMSPLLSRVWRDILAIAAAAGTAAVCALLLTQSMHGSIVYWLGGWAPRHGIALGIGLVIDPLGAGLALLAAVLVLASLVFSWRYFDEIGALYPALMLIFLGAMDGFCLTGDIFNLFVFFELMSVAAYALTGYKIEEEPALMGAFNFAVTNSIGAFLVLVGIGLLYGRTGALNLAQLGRALSTAPADGLVITALTLITCGFGIKAALVPFQFWLSDAHAVAPSPVCVLFSGVMVEMGLYAVLRVYWTVFAAAVGPHWPALRELWMALGVLTALIGGVMCFSQRHLKRMLAFSTVSHTGLFVLGLALLTPRGLAGSALYVLGHAFAKGALFLTAGILLNRFGSVDETELRGKGRKFPGLAALWLIGGLALSGLPPFGTWLGKSLIEEASARTGYSWLEGVLLAGSVLTAGAVLRAGGQIFLGLGPKRDPNKGTPKKEKKETHQDYDRPPAVMFAPTLVLLCLCLIVGVWPGLKEETERAASHFQNQQAYAAVTLGGAAPASEAGSMPGGTTLSGTLYGVGAALGAFALAAVALFPSYVPTKLRSWARRVGEPPLAVLRKLHTGQAADYVTWIVVGVAVSGTVFAVLFKV